MGKVHGFEELWRKAMRNLQEINFDPGAHRNIPPGRKRSVPACRVYLTYW